MLQRPMQCFRKSAEKVDSDQLASVVSTCSWGNHTAIGTGSAFKIHWNDENQVIWPFHLSMLFTEQNHLPFLIYYELILVSYSLQATKYSESTIYMTSLKPLEQ